jgi:hypothetical protein
MDKPYKNRFGNPAISIYLISADTPAMSELSCMWCKRTIADVKGHIDSVISTPMPLNEFDIAINIRCKMCKQNYRLLVSSN